MAVMRLALMLGFGLSPVTTVALGLLEKETESILRELTPIDVRPLPACLDDSVSGARCLPVGDFHSPTYGLASFRDIAWALGTAGLDGSRHLLVFADSANDRDVVAALLYLAGQAEVSRWPGTVADLQRLMGNGPGSARAVVRHAYYSVPMRDEFLVLSNEYEALIGEGWQTWRVDHRLSTPDSSAPVLVAAGDIRQGLSAFAHLRGEGDENVKILMAQPPPQDTRPVQTRTLTGALLVAAAVLLFILSWRTSRGRK